MNKIIEIKRIGYKVYGVAILNLWGGGQGNIDMTLYIIKKFSKNAVLDGINDGGFGCKSIDGAEINVFELYDYGVEKFYKEMVFTSKELKNAKRGI